METTEIIETADAKLLAGLNEEVQSLHHLLYPKYFKPFKLIEVKAAFDEMLNGQNAKAFVAIEEGVAVGYILFFIRKQEENPFQYAYSFIYIDQIAVSKNSRKQGVGKALLNKAIETARENRIDILQLDRWAKNESAVKFFTANGFENTKGRMALSLK